MVMVVHLEAVIASGVFTLVAVVGCYWLQTRVFPAKEDWGLTESREGKDAPRT